MMQNPNKQSQPARLAREQGARITHILPLDATGHHTLAADSGVWGCIGYNLTTKQLEPDVLSKNCAAVLNQYDVKAHKEAHGKVHTSFRYIHPTLV